jgi:GNAT superfamily N-acetyltransferase
VGRRAADLVPRALTSGADIRAATPADGAAIVELGRAIDRDQLATVSSIRALLEGPTPRTTERLTAEIDGRIVGWAPSGTYESGSGWFWIGVDASCRRHGIGGELYRRIESLLAGLGATRVETTANDGDGRAFLLARGFRVANVVRASELDPRTVPEPEPRPDVDVVPLGAALDHADTLFHLYGEARADVPSDTLRATWTFDEWRAETIDAPLIDLDASVVVLENDEPVALAWLYSDREGRRAEMLMTATRRDRSGNAPMLAINRRLGFTETALVESFAKRLA